MSNQITGIFNILATPFDENQKLDIPSLVNLVNFQIDKGAYGLTILGVLGEAAKLSVDEREQVMQTVIETVAGRIPIVVGTSHVDTGTCIALSQLAFSGGAAGVMIAPPAIENPDDEKVMALYHQIAEQVDGAIVVQDFPVVNNVLMSPALLARLANEIPNIRHLKLEDPPLMEKTTAILEQTDKYKIFGGLGGMFLLEELNRGADGTMTGFAFTEILVAFYEAFRAGDRQKASAIFDRYLPLIRFENQPGINLTIRKEILRRRGAIAHATPRDPFRPIDAGTHAELDWIFERVGISDPTQKIIFD